MKRLEIEVSDDIHAFVLELSRVHHVPARNIGGAIAFLTLYNVAGLHRALAPSLSPKLMVQLHEMLLHTILEQAKQDASDAKDV